jgi:hypothetical protein
VRQPAAGINHLDEARWERSQVIRENGKNLSNAWIFRRKRLHRQNPAGSFRCRRVIVRTAAHASLRTCSRRGDAKQRTSRYWQLTWTDSLVYWALATRTTER